jgi:mono/diheme cytochrome c family protein
MAALAKHLLDKKDPVINLYLAATLGPWNKTAPRTFMPILLQLAQLYQDKPIYHEAVVSSLTGFEKNFLQEQKNSGAWKKPGLLDTLLADVVKNKQEGKMNPIYVQAKTPVDARTNGLQLYRTNCATCHGMDGDGLEHLGPPLKGSEYVYGPTSRLAMILLNGLEGPIHINGKLYQFNNTMPNFANNFTDSQIADIIKYLHNAYVTTPVKPITPEKIKELRSKKTGTLTEKHLLEMANADE